MNSSINTKLRLGVKKKINTYFPRPLKKKMNTIFVGVPDPSDDRVVFGIKPNDGDFVYYNLQCGHVPRETRRPDEFMWYANISSPDIQLKDVQDSLTKQFRCRDLMITVLFLLHQAKFQFKSHGYNDRLDIIDKSHFKNPNIPGTLTFASEAILANPEDVLKNGLKDAADPVDSRSNYTFNVEFVEPASGLEVGDQFGGDSQFDDVDLTEFARLEDAASASEHEPHKHPLLTKKNVILGTAALGVATAGIVYRQELRNFFTTNKKARDEVDDVGALLIRTLSLASQLENPAEIKEQIIKCINHTRQLKKINAAMQKTVDAIK
jgi:hypothetical protein